MKKILLTLCSAIGLGLFSQSALAGCYCQVGHLSGNACLIPTNNGGANGMVLVNNLYS